MGKRFTLRATVLARVFEGEHNREETISVNSNRVAVLLCGFPDAERHGSEIFSGVRSIEHFSVTSQKSASGAG
jgi:hypothetical protein